jgi:hypothetical protein
MQSTDTTERSRRMIPVLLEIFVFNLIAIAQDRAAAKAEPNERRKERGSIQQSTINNSPPGISFH